MCGITGFCDFEKKSNEHTLIKMTDSLNHRGPRSGHTFYENHNSNVGLGHRRLSILDLSSQGYQPMNFKHLEIIYNGEVYNFREIRSELQKLNYSFKSNSDTEVILKAYHEWGIKAVDKFIGMFVIGIYDKKKQKIILIRDRVGIKPCYYYKAEKLFMFASELKSFHQNLRFKRSINKNALGLFMKHGYIPEPYSIFENTHKLRAGHYLEFDLKTQKIDEIKYWDIVDFYNKPKINFNEFESINELENLFRSAFEYRMISDVPVGIFLSGGYDSAIVTAILQSNRSEKLNTFTIGFKEEKYDEIANARETASYLGTNHTEYYCTQQDAIDIIQKLPEIYDEPIGDNSAIPTILVSQLAKKNVDVCLSADGGDELFGGYNKYTSIIKKKKIIDKIPNSLKSTLAVIMRNKHVHQNLSIFGNVYDVQTRCNKFAEILKFDEKQILKSSGVFSNKELDELINYLVINLETNFDCHISGDEISNLLGLDFKTFLVDDVLHKLDRATMSMTLEGREPLLDHRIVEFVAQLPSDIKIKNGNKKWILKEIVHKYLPEKMMNRSKKGFGAPVQEWLKDDLKEYLDEYVNEKSLKQHQLFNIQEVINLKKMYISGVNLNATKLWYILIFQMWYKRWMN